MERLKELFASRPEARILDVGTGSGQFISLLLELGVPHGEIVGIDVSEKAVVAARKRFEGTAGISFETMDGTRLAFPDGSFDLVCLSNSLHHLKDPAPVLEEMVRVAKPGGAVLVVEMVADGLDAKQLSHRKIHHFSAEIDRMSGILHRPTFPRTRIPGFLQKASGLPVEKSWMIDFGAAEDPSPAEIEELATVPIRQLGRIPEGEIREGLRPRAERIAAYVRAHSFASCPEMALVLRKK